MNLFKMTIYAFFLFSGYFMGKFFDFIKKDHTCNYNLEIPTNNCSYGLQIVGGSGVL